MFYGIWVFVEKLTVSQSVKEFPTFKYPKDSALCSTRFLSWSVRSATYHFTSCYSVHLRLIIALSSCIGQRVAPNTRCAKTSLNKLENACVT